MIADPEWKVKYYNLLRMFMDNNPGPIYNSCPFGIHSICQEAKMEGIMPGQWYGPQMISNVLMSINDRLKPLDKFKIVVCFDSNIVFEEIEQHINDGMSVLVLVPIRLGLDFI